MKHSNIVSSIKELLLNTSAYCLGNGWWEFNNVPEDLVVLVHHIEGVLETKYYMSAGALQVRIVN